MKVRELKEALEAYDDDLEVRIAHQPEWPFEYSLIGLASFTECCEAKAFNDDEDYKPDSKPSDGRYSGGNTIDDCLYLYDGSQIGYLPGAAKEGWEFAGSNF